MPRLVAFLFSGLIVLLARSGAAQTGFEDRVRFRVIAKGSMTSVQKTSYLNAGDPATLANGWARLGITAPVPSPIQWATERVLVICLGPRSTGGYSMQITDIRRAVSGRATVSIRENTPPPGSLVTQAVTSPYMALAVDRLQVNDFDFAWSKGNFGGIEAVPPGSVIQPTANGYIVAYPPLVGYWDCLGGDYCSYREDPGEIWIEDDRGLSNWGQSYFGDPTYVRPGIDFRSERLLAVHLGTRTEAVAIETVGFERKGDRAVLTLREKPAANARIRNPKIISPFTVVRVSREIRKLDIVWAKDK